LHGSSLLERERLTVRLYSWITDSTAQTPGG